MDRHVEARYTPVSTVRCVMDRRAKPTAKSKARRWPGDTMVYSLSGVIGLPQSP